jgi:hypothetical protein
MSREYILKELELHRSFEAEKASINTAFASRIKAVEDDNIELKKTCATINEDLEKKVNKLYCQWFDTN